MADLIRNQNRQPHIALSEGILLTDDLDVRSTAEKKEARVSLLVRAFFLFAIITGSLGGMLSAFQIPYAKWAFFLTTLLAALYCASLYAAVWWENVGYTLAFLLALYAGVGMRVYISSGFYGLLNDISFAASSFFGTDAQISYAEQVENHTLAISVAMCYFAFVGCIIMNGLISRKTRYYAAVVPSVFFLLIPVYLEREPSGAYTALFAAGILTVYALRQNRYRSHRPKAKALRKAAARHLFYGNSSAGAVLGTVLSIALLCGATAGSIALLVPRSSYMDGQENSALKLQTMDTMENFYLLGVMGLINFYPTTGGLVNGRLGGVNSIRLDYEPDLTLEFTPYTYDRIYLKTFVGAVYIPYANHWSIEDGTAYAEGWDTDTAIRLKDAFLADRSTYAQGIMKLKNVAAMSAVYLPYYSEDVNKTIRPGTEREYTYYPLLDALPAGTAKPLSSSLWLDVPEENRTAVAAFCEEAGLGGSPQEIITGLRDYFQYEYPYTLSPGITPRRKDFVNYFLTEKRKGYCAHYASSAVLILRYLGIPARYVEGYAVDASEIAADARLTEQNVADYYTGPARIPQNAVVSYDASDANAHAWVEIYDETLGWYPVEITPYRTDAEEDRLSIWDMFTRLFRNGQDMDPAGTNAADRTADTDVTAGTDTPPYRLVFCLLVLLALFPVWLAVRTGLRLYHYHRANRSEKLLLKYQDRIHRLSIRNRDRSADRICLTDTGRYRRISEPENLKSFEEQIAWLETHNLLPEQPAFAGKLVQILNKAAFSSEEISPEEFREACEHMEYMGMCAVRC